MLEIQYKLNRLPNHSIGVWDGQKVSLIEL